jgi:hypothetical protein
LAHPPRRANILYAENMAVLNVKEIGEGHFSDSHGRVFKVVLVDNKNRFDMDELVPHRSLSPGLRVVLDMRLPKKKKSERVEIINRGTVLEKKAVLFPNVGEKLMPSLQDKLQEDNGTQSTVSVTIKNRLQRNVISPVVRLFCIVE